MEVAVYRSGERSMKLVGLAALLALAALWGGSFLFIRVASPVTGPLALAELRIGLAGLALLIATSPLFGALVAAAWLRESLPGRRGTGLLLGATGVAVLVGWSPLPRDGSTILAVGAYLLAALCYGVAAAYTKARAPGLPPLTLATGSQIGAALLLLPTPPLAPPRAWLAPGVALCVATLALASTAVAYLSTSG